ncbi:PfkB family carbohydrate kinase, partial [Salmonella enterica subsp. enterica serovar Anatum]|nr:PfkB family carbohydrate kinase [Salmonella enterica subsp. enterica serovar Anatum]
RLARRTDGGEVNSSVAGVSALTTVIAGKTASEINVRIRNNVNLAYDGTQFIYSPAFPAVVKNTAGAGDAFNGALASGLAKGKSL